MSEESCETCSYSLASGLVLAGRPQVWCLAFGSECNPGDCCARWTQWPIHIDKDLEKGIRSLCRIGHCILLAIVDAQAGDERSVTREIQNIRNLATDAEIHLADGYDSHEEGESNADESR